MRLSKSAAEPIRQYLIQVKQRLALLPAEEATAALKAMQDRVVEQLKSQVAGRDPDVNDTRRAVAAMPKPEQYAQSIIHRSPADAGPKAAAKPSPATPSVSAPRAASGVRAAPALRRVKRQRLRLWLS